MKSEKEKNEHQFNGIVECGFGFEGIRLGSFGGSSASEELEEGHEEGEEK